MPIVAHRPSNDPDRFAKESGLQRAVCCGEPHSPHKCCAAWFVPTSRRDSAGPRRPVRKIWLAAGRKYPEILHPPDSRIDRAAGISIAYKTLAPTRTALTEESIHGRCTEPAAPDGRHLRIRHWHVGRPSGRHRSAPRNSRPSRAPSVLRIRADRAECIARKPFRDPTGDPPAHREVLACAGGAFHSPFMRPRLHTNNGNPLSKRCNSDRTFPPASGTAVTSGAPRADASVPQWPWRGSSPWDRLRCNS